MREWKIEDSVPPSQFSLSLSRCYHIPLCSEQVKHLSYRPVPCSDDQWDRWVASHPDGHLLQTSRWGSLKQQFGWRQRRATVVDEDGAIRGGALILFRRAFGLTLAYVPKGPRTDWRDGG